MRSTVTAALAFAVLLVPGAARAHHEAIFGPQSSLMFSSDGFVSAQVFSRRLGSAPLRTQESTAVISGGLSPWAGAPVSFSILAPVSYIAPLDGGESELGLEDVVLGARYRLDLPALQQRFDRPGNFVLGMVGVEAPTGTIDHDAFDGPFGWMTAALGSLEWGSLSAIGYVFFHRHLEHDQVKHGDNLFTGAGLAWTPWEDPATERLVSVQLGASYELETAAHAHGAGEGEGEAELEGGGWSVLAHPAVVWGPGGHLLLFALVSIPLAQDRDLAATEERWRAGTGVIYLFDH